MKCQICFNNYNHSEHKPYVLIPCTHTLCIRCLDDLSGDPKQCPLCTLTIKDYNPNWAILDMIPETNFGHLKYSLEKSLNESENIKKKLNELNKQNFKDTIVNLKEVKQEISNHANYLIEMIQNSQNKLIGDVKNIESTLEIDLSNQVKYDQQLDFKIKETRKRLAKNELNESQINSLSAYFSKLNTDLTTRITEKLELKNEFKFQPNSSFQIQKESLGKVNNLHAVNNHDVIVHKRAFKCLEEKRFDSALELLDRSLEANNDKCSLCFNYKGLALHGLSEFVEAVNCFNKSIEIDGNNSEVFTNKANTLKELRDFSGAIRYYSIGLNKSTSKPN